MAVAKKGLTDIAKGEPNPQRKAQQTLKAVSSVTIPNLRPPEITPSMGRPDVPVQPIDVDPILSPPATPEKKEIPSVLGLSEEEAKKRIEDNGLKVHLSEGGKLNINGECKPKTVYSQYPKAGMTTYAGASVLISMCY